MEFVDLFVDSGRIRKKRRLKSLIIPEDNKNGVWIVRDQEGFISYHVQKPEKINGVWESNGGKVVSYLEVWKTWHPEITSETEPIKIRYISFTDLMNVI